jgi:hypothetical protein
MVGMGTRLVRRAKKFWVMSSELEVDKKSGTDEAAWGIMNGKCGMVNCRNGNGTGEAV